MANLKKVKMGDKLIIGWNEWCRLPKLNLPAIKAKIDTGAKTSSLHADNIKAVIRNKKKYVYYDVHPIQRNNDIVVRCRSLVIDERSIMSSNGQKERRYIIATSLRLGTKVWDIELSLSNRDPLKYRLLLGREALSRYVVINPGTACHQIKYKNIDIINLYENQLKRG